MARQTLRSSTGLAVLTLAVGTAAAAQEPLAPNTVDDVVDVFASFREPVRFGLTRTKLILEADDSLLAGPEFQALQELLDHGPTGASSELVHDALDGIDWILRAVDARPDPHNDPRTNVVGSRIVSTPDVQIESLDESIPGMSLVFRRDRFLDLKCTEALQGEIHMHATVANPRWIQYDLPTLVKPIMAAPAATKALRDYDWQRLPSSHEGALVASATWKPGDLREFRFELDPGTLLPVAAAFRAYDELDGFSDVALYQHGPVGADGAQIGLRAIVGASVHAGRIVLTRFLLDDVRFDVEPEHLVAEIPAATRLYDWRHAEERMYRRGGGDWPAEVSERVRFDGEFVAPIGPAILPESHDHDHVQVDSASTSPDRGALAASEPRSEWMATATKGLGALLVLIGAVSLFATSRREEVRA